MKGPILLTVAFALAGQSGASRADEAASGQEVYEQRCRTCHGGTARADSPIGPRLAGIAGTKAGAKPSGIALEGLPRELEKLLGLARGGAPVRARRGLPVKERA